MKAKLINKNIRSKMEKADIKLKKVIDPIEEAVDLS